MLWWLVAVVLAQETVGLPIPSTPGPWMRGSESVCVALKSRGRSVGARSAPVGEGLTFTCRRSDKRLDEICLTIDDVAAWPETWPEKLACDQGTVTYDVRPYLAFDPVRARGEVLWIRRSKDASIAYTWTLPEGPINEQGRAIRKDGRPWEGITCEGRGMWLSLAVDPSTPVDEGRCQFRDDVSIAIRLENVPL